MKKMAATMYLSLSETNVNVHYVCEHVEIFKCLYLEDLKRMLTNLELRLLTFF